MRLIGNVRHHVEEEETELFPKLRASITTSEMQDMDASLAPAKKVAPDPSAPQRAEHPAGQHRGWRGRRGD